MIELLTAPTPNGWKISIMLEECALPYRVRQLNIGKGEQFAPDFLAISPNNRIPAIIDHAPADAGEPISVFGREKMLDFTYVDDCVAGVTAGIDALATSRVVDETINLAYGQGQTLYDLVTLIELATGRQAEATYLPSQTGEVTRYVADISKARQLLAYDPQTPLTRGIAQYVKWCKESGFLG